MWLAVFVYVLVSFVAVDVSSLPFSNQELTPEEFVALGGNADEYANDILIPKKRNGIEHRSNRWPNGVIPYVIDRNMPAHAHGVLQRVFGHYHQRTCIKFVPRTNQRDYVLITKPNDQGCNSFVGKIGGAQKMNLPDWCINEFGAVVHEMMHAIGFHHEQSRPDRDSYITVNWQNIKDDAKGIFYVAKGALTYGTKYDYGSLMHYGSKAFSKNGGHTLVPKHGVSVSAIGQRKDLTATDIYKINAMYQCNGKTTGGGGGGGGGSCVDKHANCGAWASRNPSECQRNPAYMHQNCRKSCNLCSGTGCTDQHASCSAWASRNPSECQANPAYMLANCKKSCRVC